MFHPNPTLLERASSSGSDSLLSIALSDLDLLAAPPGLWDDLTTPDPPTPWDLPSAPSTHHELIIPAAPPSSTPVTASAAAAALDAALDGIFPAAAAPVAWPEYLDTGLPAGCEMKRQDSNGAGKPGKAHRFCVACGVVNHVRRSV
eukprot:CAMPEP_0184717932 /NCGR_PEP_ID=MMETSP0314-20130426/7255_1 /TAXON_ID=38298 /ORGANISM="Rhodella maculata, Strain CCMP 736" /LENGTH=145 /DNA_ID=CAMNT_0027181581 /DNA_START=263 /DNA_END=696 /DNA_ORIENTATION=+